MILECTACGARYLVPDSAIGAEGRTVRCASCRHSWYQAPALLDLSSRDRIEVPEAPVAAEAPEAAPETDSPVGEAPPEVRTYEDEAYSKPRPAYDAFAHRPPFGITRNPTKRWTAAAVVAGCSMMLGAGAILYSGAPGIAAQLGLPIGPTVTPLRFVDEAIERRDRGRAGELFVVSGKVVNPTGSTQRVPDVVVELRDTQNRTVYQWSVTPGTRTLAPNAAVAFTSGRTDVPANSKMLKLSFAKGLAK
ncbi:zinc-ribbon domain-containing protein [Sphingomonas sp. RS2018]